MYIGHSLQIAEMELAERRRVAARKRLVRDARTERGMPRPRGLTAVLESVRLFGALLRLTRPIRTA